MQTDLQVLLAITGAVCGVYMISNVVKRRSRQSSHSNDSDLDSFDELAGADAQADPLMDDATPVAQQMTQANENEAILTPKKRVIVDDQVTGTMPNETSAFASEGSYSEEPHATMPYVALTVMARDGESISGDVLFKALKANHMYYSAEQVFHRHVNDSPMQSPIYTALSMMEPGVFDMDRMQSEEFPGVVLLMTLPTRQNPLMIFEKMLNTARQLAVSLNGELCDGARKPLTAPMMSRLREKIQQSHRRHLTHAHASPL